MSAITAKSLNSTLGTGNFRSFDELLGDMFAENRKMHYVPSRYILFSVKKSQKIESSKIIGEAFFQALTEIRLKNGGVIFFEGGVGLSSDVYFTSNKKVKMSKYFVHGIESGGAGGREGYFLQFEPDSNISMWVRPTKQSDGDYYINLDVDFFGSLAPGTWDFVEDPVVINYEV